MKKDIFRVFVIFILIMLAVGMTPAWEQQIKIAADTWPANSVVTSSVLNLYPSPLDLILSFIFSAGLFSLLKNGSQLT